MRRLFVAAALAAIPVGALTGCLTSKEVRMPALATAEIAGDFHTYAIQRVGILPFGGQEVPESQGRALQLGLFSELAQSTPYELVLLEVESSEPHRRGYYRPATIIQLAGRYRLDAFLFGTVTQQRFYPPQILALGVDMVSAETGMVIWSSSLYLDATDPRVADGLMLFYGDGEEGREWRMALLSPERFARFAAFQIASLL